MFLNAVDDGLRSRRLGNVLVTSNGGATGFTRFPRRHDAGQKDDGGGGKVGVAGDFFGDLASLNVGHANIEQDQVGPEVAGRGQALGGVVEFSDLIGARSLECQFYNARGVEVVVNDQDSVFFHEKFLSVGSGSAMCAISRLLSMQAINRCSRGGLATK